MDHIFLDKQKKQIFGGLDIVIVMLYQRQSFTFYEIKLYGHPFFNTAQNLCTMYMYK